MEKVHSIKLYVFFRNVLFTQRGLNKERQRERAQSMKSHVEPSGVWVLLSAVISMLTKAYCSYREWSTPYLILTILVVSSYTLKLINSTYPPYGFNKMIELSQRFHPDHPDLCYFFFVFLNGIKIDICLNFNFCMQHFFFQKLCYFFVFHISCYEQIKGV